jgi:adhesin transport system outer membrane protein
MKGNMAGWRKSATVSILLLLITAACDPTPRNLVVLLPDANGKVGEATVTTSGGTTVLRTAGATTSFDDANAAPTEPYDLKIDTLDSIFKTAITAQPTPPISFTLYFRTGKTRMAPESQALWPTILAEIQSRPVPDISIIGHTDRAGPDTYNEPLSRRRARIIQRNLVMAGIEASVIDFSWHGEKNPIVQTPDGVPERRNRRVEIIVR